jgi:hypothetical protein
MSMHRPVRPDWTCQTCGQAWPCPTRQRQLLAEYDGARVSLMLYLSSQLITACVDLPAAASGVLYERFLGWARAGQTQR